MMNALERGCHESLSELGRRYYPEYMSLYRRVRRGGGLSEAKPVDSETPSWGKKGGIIEHHDTFE
jgi:hypothetical protein